MRVAMKLVLEGLPERIQEAADILDRAFPGAIAWSDVTKLGRNHTMRLEGATLLRDRTRRPPGRIKRSSSTTQASRFSSSAVREGHQRDQFCTSPFRGVQS